MHYRQQFFLWESNFYIAPYLPGIFSLPLFSSLANHRSLVVTPLPRIAPMSVGGAADVRASRRWRETLLDNDMYLRNQGLFKLWFSRCVYTAIIVECVPYDLSIRYSQLSIILHVKCVIFPRVSALVCSLLVSLASMFTFTLYFLYFVWRIWPQRNCSDN